MPFNGQLPDQGTNPWYTPFKTVWDALVAFVDDLEAAIQGLVPESRTVAGKPLSADVTITAGDVGARPSDWTPAVADIPALPISKTSGLQAALDGKADDADLVGKVNTADVAGLNDAGWARAIYIPSGGTVPAGTPTYTLVIEES